MVVLGIGYGTTSNSGGRAITVPSGTTSVFVNGSYSAGGSAGTAGPVYVSSLSGTSAQITDGPNAMPNSQFSWTAFR